VSAITEWWKAYRYEHNSQHIMLTLILAPFVGTSGTGTSKLNTQSLMVGPGLSILTWRHNLIIFVYIDHFLYWKKQQHILCRIWDILCPLFLFYYTKSRACLVTYKVSNKSLEPCTRARTHTQTRQKHPVKGIQLSRVDLHSSETSVNYWIFHKIVLIFISIGVISDHLQSHKEETRWKLSTSI
jgi:hypothetical protein